MLILRDVLEHPLQWWLGHQLLCCSPQLPAEPAEWGRYLDPHPLHCKVSQGSLTYHRRLFESNPLNFALLWGQ